MSWRIVMIEQGEYLRLKLDNLFVQKGQNDYTIPLNDISILIISNLNTVLSARLLDAFASHNIALVICDYKHHPSGLFTGLNTHSRASKILQQQLSWDDTFKDFTWSFIVRAKVKNQRDILQLYAKDQEGINLLSGYLEEIFMGDTTNREGHAAKVYFNAIFGKAFTRSLDEDIRNTCLNYGYSVIRAYFARLIVGYGFTGMIGVHHKNEYNNFNLVDDLMEPFRPIFDGYVLNLITEDTIFDFETRYQLVDFLHEKIHYEGKQMLMLNAMEKYVQSFVRYCKTGELTAFLFPELIHECV